MKTYDHEQIARDNLDVKSVSGDELVCLCPFHGDSTPSLWFNKRKGLWTCYACNEGGSTKTLLRKLGKPVGSEKSTDFVPGHVRMAEALLEQLATWAAEKEAKTCPCHAKYRQAVELHVDQKSGIDSINGLGYNLVLKSLTNVTTGTSSGRCIRCNKPLIIPEKNLIRYTSSGSLSSYLSSRGISSTPVDGKPSRARGSFSSTSALFELGWDPISRAVVMPYRTEYGHLLGVVHRRLHGRPKYNYPRKFPRTETLFGSWLLTKNLVDLPRLRRDVLPEKWVVLCEGPFDVMKCWQAGLPAVGMWGSMLHDKQAQILSKLGVKGVVVFTDRDSAGRAAAVSAAGKLLRANFAVRVVTYPRSYPESHSDPGSLSEALIRSRVRRAKRVERWEL